MSRQRVPLKSELVREERDSYLRLLNAVQRASKAVERYAKKTHYPHEGVVEAADLIEAALSRLLHGRGP